MDRKKHAHATTKIEIQLLLSQDKKSGTRKKHYVMYTENIISNNLQRKFFMM